MTDYITIGLLAIVLGNLIYLERMVATLKGEVKHLKRHICQEKGATKSKS